MTSLLSVRARVLFGAVLWTFGLFMAAGIVVNVVMVQHPNTPRVLHGFFAHPVASPGAALVSMLWGLWQVRKGLSPLQHLRDRLANVREGRDRRVDGRYPAE